MKKDVLISINGRPKYDGISDDESIELITAGRFYKKNGHYYIMYKESELTGLDGITTTLKIESNRITMIRNGTNASHMIFEPGQKHIGLYNTGFGAMTVAISAQRVFHNISDDGGELEIEYSIEVDHALTGENTFHIEFHETPPAILPS